MGSLKLVSVAVQQEINLFTAAQCFQQTTSTTYRKGR